MRLLASRFSWELRLGVFKTKKVQETSYWKTNLPKYFLMFYEVKPAYYRRLLYVYFQFLNAVHVTKKVLQNSASI